MAIYFRQSEIATRLKVYYVYFTCTMVLKIYLLGHIVTDLQWPESIMVWKPTVNTKRGIIDNKTVIECLNSQ